MTSAMQHSAAYENPMVNTDDERSLRFPPLQYSNIPASSSSSEAAAHPPVLFGSPIMTDITQTQSNSFSGDYECEDNHNTEVTEMRGFKVFLMATQLICLIVMASAVCVSHITKSSTAWPITIFFFLEQCVFVVAIIHACRPSIRMLLAFLSLDIAIAIGGIVLALVVVIKDGGKECDRDSCSTLPLGSLERFRFFWFLLAKATFSLFFSLIAVAYSPQVHDFLAEDDDECEQAIFRGEIS